MDQSHYSDAALVEKECCLVTEAFFPTAATTFHPNNTGLTNKEVTTT
jgi:hypothetical protein